MARRQGWMNYEELVLDPRPDLHQDSQLWTSLLRQTIILPDFNTADMLVKRFWTMRSIGTIIHRTHLDTRFEPLYEPDGGWPSKEFYMEMREKYLVPYGKIISELLRKVGR